MTDGVVSAEEQDDELDLTKVEPTKNIGSAAKPILFAPGHGLTKIEEVRERVRSRIAYLLITLLFINVIASFSLFALGKSFTEMKDLLIILYSPLIGIIGTVLGFYFGSETSKGK